MRESAYGPIRRGHAPNEQRSLRIARGSSCRCLLLLAALLVSAFPYGEASLSAQSSRADLPFVIGEELVYSVRLGRLGERGQATMSVTGPVEVRGRETYLLSFDFRSRIGLIVIEDRAQSWLDPERMVALRYEKHERSPLSSRHEEVELYPEEGYWRSEAGSGRMATGAPLDEISFLYYIRTLPLADGEVYTLHRHFDPNRNPVVVRVLRRERVVVPAGDFAAILVEMRVTDTGRFGGEGSLRIHLTDDARRIPLRIESSMPVVGSTVLSLDHMIPR